HLERANAQIGGVDNTLSLIGPMIGGALILIISPVTLLWLNAISFLIAGLIALMIKEKELPITTGKIHIWREMWLGIKDSRKNKVIWNGAILFFFIQLGTTLFQANLAYFATGILHGNSFDYGLFLSGTGIGALIGVMLAPRIIKHFRSHSGKLIIFCAIFSGLSLSIISAFHLKNFILISCALGLSALFDNIIVISYFSLRQRVVAAEILGRVVSVTRTISYLSIPIGAFVGGILLNYHLSIYWIIWIAVIIEILSAVWAYFTPLAKTIAE
ncbi:MAG: MFS transporter, partial [Streptococcaceae bacterium]|nr:MFS transporter [Streptococcaceae bacterium]